MSEAQELKSKPESATPGAIKGIPEQPNGPVDKKRKRAPTASSPTQVESKRQRETSSSESPSERESPDEGDDMSQYRYTKLKPGEIRILTLYPRGASPNRGSILDCSLRIRAKTDRATNDSKDPTSPKKAYTKEPYEALSYVWGNQEAIHPIHIRTKTGTSEFKVTPNLLAALEHLQHKDKNRHFWIDAICINQKSDEELSQQVPLMSQIYSEAQNVCVWLGQEGDNSKTAITLVNKIRKLENFDKVVEDHTNCDEWAALIKLMQRPWFTRRWVVQEITLAKEATIHCGDDSISWTSFSEAIALFEDAADRVNQKFKSEKKYGHNSNYVGDVKEYAASRLVAATNNVVRKSPDNRILMKVRGLEYLLSTLTPFRARKPHDIVYAVLSLAKDIPGSSAVIAPESSITNDASYHLKDNTTTADMQGEDSNAAPLTGPLKNLANKVVTRMKVQKYPVEYSKPFIRICTDFLEFVFQKSGSLDMLCRPWAPKQSDETGQLPTWIQTLEDESYGPIATNNSMVRRKADFLVGRPGESIYSASGKYPAEWQWADIETTPTLKVRGFVLDTVRKKADAAHCGVVPSKWFTLGGWTDQEQYPPESFWKTMVADRDHVGSNPPAFYPLVCRLALLGYSVEGSAVNTDSVLNQSEVALLKKFVRRLQSVIWNRRLALTKSHSYLALIPEQARKGDVICIIPGCSVPLVLRQAKKGNEPSLYKFIGESYVHGMMDGEAFQIKAQQNIGYKWFNLR